MRAFQVPSQITGISTKADRSLAIRVTTEREMSPEETTLLLSYVRKTGWMLFKENEYKEDEIPNADAPTGHKTPSQELRSKLFRLFKQEHPDKPEKDFQHFYTEWMYRIIEKVRAKLD